MRGHRVGLPSPELAADIRRFDEVMDEWWAPIPDPNPMPVFRLWGRKR